MILTKVFLICSVFTSANSLVVSQSSCQGGGTVNFPSSGAGTLTCSGNTCTGCTINCHHSQDCIIKCTDTDGCVGMKVNCGDNSNCVVQCDKRGGCFDIRVKQPKTGKLTMTCGSNACKSSNSKIIRNSPSTGDLFLNCELKGCSQMTVDCPDGLCQVGCDVSDSCSETIINGADGKLELSCTRDNACIQTTINCPDSNTCDVNCDSPNSCQSSNLNCPGQNGGVCDLDCKGSRACYELTVRQKTTAQGGTVNINCDGKESCSKIDIDCGSASVCDTTCLGFNSCVDSEFRCRNVREKCSLKCNGVQSCYLMSGPSCPPDPAECTLQCQEGNACEGIAEGGLDDIWCTSEYSCRAVWYSSKTIQGLFGTPAPVLPTSVPSTPIPPTSPPTIVPPTSIPSTPIPKTPIPILQTQVPQTQVPQTQVPQTQVPQTQVPQTQVPQTQVPQTQVPQTQVPQTQVPQTQVPQTQVPQTQVPQTQVPQTQVPQTQVPQTQVPQTQVPQTQVPQTQVPQTQVPQTQVPQTQVPQTQVPQTQVPQTQVPQTQVPQTQVPQTQVPQTQVPQTQVPQTQVPQTQVPQTQVPQTQVPQTQVPQTQVPQTQVPQTVGSPTPSSITLAPLTTVPETNSAIPASLIPTLASKIDTSIGTLPEKEKEKVEIASAVAGVASAVMMSPGGVGSVAKLNVAMSFGCRVDDVDLTEAEQLDWEFHPSRIGFDFAGKHRKYMAAALIMNPVILIGLGIVQVVVVCFLYRINGNIEKSKGDTKMPGLLLLPYLYLLQGTTLIACRVVFQPSESNTATLIIGWTVLVLCVVSPFMIWRKVLRRISKEAIQIPDPRIHPGDPLIHQLIEKSNKEFKVYVGMKAKVYAFVFGKHIWVSVTPNNYFVEQFGVVFESFKSDRVYFVVVEISVLLCLSFFSAWQPGSNEVLCNTRNVFICLLFGSFALSIIILRPFTAVFDNLLAALLAVIMFSAVLLMTVALWANKTTDGIMYTFATWLLLVSAVIVALKMIWDFVTNVIDMKIKRRSGARLGHRNASVEDGVVTELFPVSPTLRSTSILSGDTMCPLLANDSPASHESLESSEGEVTTPAPVCYGGTRNRITIRCEAFFL